MSYEFNGFAQQGWQCPVCHRVYSPTTPMCYYCGNYETTTSTSMTIGNADIDIYSKYLNHNVDFLHHETVTETEKQTKDK